MNKALLRQIVVVVLLFVFVLLWMSLRQKTTVETSVPGEALAPAPVSISPSGPPKEEEIKPIQAEEFKLPARNPFDLPPLLRDEIQRREEAARQRALEAQAQIPGGVTPPVELPSLKLQGVFWGVPRPQAIINRRVLYVGDAIEGYTVTSITKEGVKVSFNQQEFLLTLPVRSGKEEAFR